MKKHFKRIGAFILCLVLLMGVSTMAAEFEPDTETIVVSVSKGDAESEYEGGNVISGELSGQSTVLEAPKPVIVAVQVPKKLDFVIDPCNLCEKGDIWSEDYSFCNNSSVEVKLVLADIRCVLKPGVIAAESGMDSEAVEAASEKVVMLQLILENGDILDIDEAGSGLEVVLAPGESLTFSVGGYLSTQPSEGWSSGDVSLELLYDVQLTEE